MTLQIIPAIDLHKGKCVRLVKGKLDEVTVYYDEPMEALRRFEIQGATRIHVVDLDAAFGFGNNLETIQRLSSTSDVMIQVGGGIRTPKVITRLLSLGVSRLILGTIAVQHPKLVASLIEEFGTERFSIAVDEKNGKVAIEGWQQTSEKSVSQFIEQMISNGATSIIYTATKRDGTLEGVDIAALQKVPVTNLQELIASGGVGSLQDIVKLRKVVQVTGVIVGKALYERRFSYREAMEVEN